MTAIAGALGIAEPEFRVRADAAFATMSDRGGRVRRHWAAGPLCMAAAQHVVETGENPHRQGDLKISLAYDGHIYQVNGTRLGGAFDLPRTCSELVNAYRLVGPDLFGSLEGSFALVLFDRRQRRLYVAKDAFGTKPMFYRDEGATFFFASEVSGLLALARCSCDTDLEALDTYLSLGYVPAPCTMLRGVRQLTPGHYLEIREDGVLEERCHRPAPRARWPSSSQETWAPTLRKLLAKAVAKRFDAHPDAGILLSGGVDTAALVCAAKQEGLPLETFTMRFPDQPAVDESHAARWLAEKVDARHTEITIDESCLSCLDSVVRHVGAPLANPAALIANSLFSQVGRSVDTVMCGDGGNEIFGGTYKYHQVMHHIARAGRTKWLSLVERVGQKVWRHVEDTLLDELFQKLARRYFQSLGQPSRDPSWAVEQAQFEEAACFYAALNSVWTRTTKHHLYAKHMRAELADRDSTRPLMGLFSCDARAQSLLQQLSYVRTASFIPYEVMPYVEFSAVASGVVPLFPLLDEQLTDFMFRVPYSHVFGRGFRHLMERALSGSVVPNKVFKRAHKGFKPPLDTWLRTPRWRGVAEDLLSTASISQRGLFSPKFVEDVLRRYYAGERYLPTEDSGRVQPIADLLWSIMVLEAWFRHFRPTLTLSRNVPVSHEAH